MTKTITELTEATSADIADWMAIWRAANGDTRKITKANFIGATLTGGGTIATGGFDLTVPATGTAALLGTAQTFTQAQTFGAGIVLGNEALTIFDEGTWTPEVTAATPPTITYTLQSGKYWRFNNLVMYNLTIVINTITGNNNAARITLPFTVAAAATAPLLIIGPDAPGTPISVVFRPGVFASYGNIVSVQDNATVSNMETQHFAAGDTITATGFYETS